MNAGQKLAKQYRRFGIEVTPAEALKDLLVLRTIMVTAGVNDCPNTPEEFLLWVNQVEVGEIDNPRALAVLQSIRGRNAKN